MGLTILLGQQIGRGEKEVGGKSVGTGIIFFIIIAVIMSIAMLFLAPLLSSLMNAPQEAFNKTVAYLRICEGGMVVIVAYNLIGCIFRGLGDSKTPLTTVAIACVFNIVGDLILCAIFEMGTEGDSYSDCFCSGCKCYCLTILDSSKRTPFYFTSSISQNRSTDLIKNY